MGAALGAGQAISARLAARASLLAVPLVWVVVAALLLEPDSQKGILWLFTKASLRIPLHHRQCAFWKASQT